jgi:hypothetical protein
MGSCYSEGDTAGGVRGELVCDKRTFRAQWNSFQIARDWESSGSLPTSPLIVTNLAIHIRVRLPRRFSGLTVFDARLDIRVRRIDEPT